MALFEFTLRKLNATMEFNSSWSWFWLTDGSYNINLGEVKLFTYNAKTALKWVSKEKQLEYEEKTGMSYNEPDYYVVRLYEDLLDDALPYTLESVSELAHSLLINRNALEKARDYWDNLLEPLNDENRDELWQKYEDCSEGINSGSLGSGYMALPETDIWRYQDNVYLYWNSTGKDGDNDDWFETPLQGICVIPFKQFIDEVYDFHERFMDAMQKRIEEIQPHFITQKYHYSYEELLKEHSNRKKSLVDSLANGPNKVNHAIFEQSNLENGIDLRELLKTTPTPELHIIHYKK